MPKFIEREGAGSSVALRSISLVSRRWSIFDEMQIFYLQIINHRPFSTDHILYDGLTRCVRS